MFNIWGYVLALLLGVMIGYAIHQIIQFEANIKQYKQKEKDGLIYIEPKPARSDLKVAEQEWRESASRKI